MDRVNKPEQNKVLSLLGLATRAREVVSGGFATEQAVKCGKAQLVIIAENASDNTKKKFSNMCTFYEVPYVVYGEMDALGHAMGKQERTTIAVTNSGFADSIHKQITNGTGSNSWR